MGDKEQAGLIKVIAAIGILMLVVAVVISVNIALRAHMETTNSASLQNVESGIANVN